MITNLETGKSYPNRKDAKRDLGSAYYNKLVRERKFTFHDGREVIADYKKDNED